MIILNPCPICGGNGRLIKGSRHKYIICINCQMAATKLCFTDEEAVDEWNSFVPIKATERKR